MSELDLVRDLYPERASDPAVRARVRGSVAARTFAAPRRLGPRWLVPAAATVCAAATASAVFLFAGAGGGTGTAQAAARLLRAAARAVRDEPPLGTLGPNQYLYTKSVNAYLDETVDRGSSWAALVPNVREIWLRRDGTGWLYQTSGAPTFLSDHDRQAWIAAGKPSLGGRVMDVQLRNSDGPTPPMASLDLPSDPDALDVLLEREAGRFGDRKYQEMFTLIGDALRENYTTPAQRAALFEVAARLPGIVYVGDVTDSLGRAGLAVAMDEGSNAARDELVFAKGDYSFLAEETRVLAGNPSGYAPGTVVGHATYVEQRIVDAVPDAVVKGATG